MPVTLLKRFVDEDGYLHVFRAGDGGGALFRRRPEDLFTQRELYTTEPVAGILSREMEFALSRQESECEPILSRLVDAARQGTLPRLSPDEREHWFRFFFLQWKRVPDLHLTVTTPEEAGAIFDGVLADARVRHPHRLDEINAFERADVRARMIKNARVSSLSRAPAGVIEALRFRGIGIARVAGNNKRFVIGSRPVVKLTRPGKTNLRHPECELWLPIASDVMVGLGKGPATETLVNCTPDQVRGVNLAIVSQGTMFASGSQALTRSLAAAR